MDRRFHGERGEKVADAQHVALGGRSRHPALLPTEPANGGIGLDMAVGQVAQVGMAGAVDDRLFMHETTASSSVCQIPAVASGRERS